MAAARARAVVDAQPMPTNEAIAITYAPAPPRVRSVPDSGADLVIVNEQIGEIGGTERVLAALVERYPQARVLAPRFGAANAGNGDQPDWAGRVEELGNGARKRHHLAPVYARWVSAAAVGRPSVVVSLAHGGWGAAVTVPPGARHVCYCAGLPRALYGHARDYLLDYPPPVRPLLRGSLPLLRAHHRRMLRRPDRMLTNSHDSAAALAPILGRAPEVVYPPVRTDFFNPPSTRRARHFLVVARLRPHKRVDVVVEAFRELDEQLVVAGGGPWLDSLRERAPANVSFPGFVSDHELRRLYRDSHAVICPSVEEFGLVMAEAQASGAPVVAPRAGGALEIVSDGETGLLIDRVDVAGVRAAVRDVTARSFDAPAVRASGERFSAERFVERIEAVVDYEHARARSATRG
jgi:glycosyltransferase involved in cell wall biosynthesis